MLEVVVDENVVKIELDEVEEIEVDDENVEVKDVVEVVVDEREEMFPVSTNTYARPATKSTMIVLTMNIRTILETISAY